MDEVFRPYTHTAPGWLHSTLTILTGNGNPDGSYVCNGVYTEPGYIVTVPGSDTAIHLSAKPRMCSCIDLTQVYMHNVTFTISVPSKCCLAQLSIMINFHKMYFIDFVFYGVATFYPFLFFPFATLLLLLWLYLLPFYFYSPFVLRATQLHSNFIANLCK